MATRVRARQQLERTLREIRTERSDAPTTDADRLRWITVETEQLRQEFTAKRLAYLDAIKHSMMLSDTVVTAAHQAMNAAALDYALAADFTAMARSLGD